MNHLSYETLYNLKDMLIKQINKENKAVDLFNMDAIRLEKLQNDLKVANQLLAKKRRSEAKAKKQSVTI